MAECNKRRRFSSLCFQFPFCRIGYWQVVLWYAKQILKQVANSTIVFLSLAWTLYPAFLFYLFEFLDQLFFTY